MPTKAEATTIDVPAYMQAVGRRARAASRVIGRAETRQKNAALLAIAAAIETARERLKSENGKDLAAGRQAGLDEALLDRLELNAARIAAMAQGLREIAALPDPVGGVSD